MFGAFIVIGCIPAWQRPAMWWYALFMVAFFGWFIASVWLADWRARVFVDNRARRVIIRGILSTSEFSFDDVQDVNSWNNYTRITVAGRKRPVGTYRYMSGPSNLGAGLTALARFNSSPELRRVAPHATRSFPTGGIPEIFSHLTPAAFRAARAEPAERAAEP